ncbi:MAG: radical SAM protein [Pirellulales bacterium]|nr:radical SAM protein [Pirellulales bacterium]
MRPSSLPRLIAEPTAAGPFDRSPLMFYYEVTQACDLVCQHCRASAQECADPDELSPAESLALVDEVARFPAPPTIVLTGGDPLKRADLFALIARARERGLRVAVTPSATPLADRPALERLKDAGVMALGISLDGASAASHDAFRGWEGSYARTFEMLSAARELGLPVQVNTSLTTRNFSELEQMAEQLDRFEVVMWSVFFLVPVGRGVDQPRLSANEYESAFERLYRESARRNYAIKTTEAPHYRRFVLQHGGDPQSRPAASGRRVPLGVRDGKGIMFVGCRGEIFPAGFLPLECGRFPHDSPVEVYQSHPTFVALRDASQLKGRCGACEYREVCGGSRARAFAVYGDPLEEEPDCAYVPSGDEPLVMP